MRKPGFIYVSYLDANPPQWADTLVRELDGTFPHEVRRLEVDLNMLPAHSPERNQFHATLILASLLRSLPDSDARILGVTSVDLYIPVLTFLFGQAQLDGPGAVLSTFRLRNEYYGLPPSQGLLLDRTMKEAVHELGHTFGLVHCRDPRCVMTASTYVEEVDLKGEWYCPECEARAGVGANPSLLGRPSARYGRTP